MFRNGFSAIDQPPTLDFFPALFTDGPTPRAMAIVRHPKPASSEGIVEWCLGTDPKALIVSLKHDAANVASLGLDISGAMASTTLSLSLVALFATPADAARAQEELLRKAPAFHQLVSLLRAYLDLQRQNRLIVAALDSLPHPFWIMDKQPRYVVQNCHDAANFGDLVGKILAETDLPDDMRASWERVNSEVLAGASFQKDMVKETASGQIVGETSLAPIRIEGEVVGIVGLSVDRTERARIEDELRQAQARLKDFVHAASDWVWESDADLRFTFIEGDTEKHGIDFQSWIGRTRWELSGIAPFEDPHWRTFLDAVAARAPIRNFVFGMHRDDGTPIWAEVNAIPKLDETGALIGYRGSTRDVTEREELFRKASRSNLVANLTKNAVIVLDKSFRITWANPAFEELTGYSASEALGCRPSDLLRCEKTDPVVAATIQKAIDDGAGVRAQLVNRTKQGRDYWVDVDMRPIRSDSGELEGFITVESDITPVISAQERISRIIENVACGIVIRDGSGAIVSVNPEAHRLLGLSEEDIFGSARRDPRSVMLNENLVPIEPDEVPGLRALRLLQDVGDVTIAIRRQDGRLTWLRVNARILNDMSGDVRSISSFVEVTRDREQQAEIAAAHKDTKAALAELDAYRAALDQHSIVAITDRAGRITYVNDLFCKISGYPRDELIGSTHSLINSGSHHKRFFRDMWRTIANGSPWRAEICNRHKTGSLYWVDTTIVPMFDTAGKIDRYVSIRYDITDRKRVETEIRHSAEHDALTGLVNRNVFMERLNACLAWTRANDRGGLVALLDLDHFKDLNDTLGHDVGDAVLKAIAERLRQSVRGTDTVARLGGDEFAILMPGIASAHDADQAIVKLHRAISQPLVIEGKSIHPEVSIGITLFPQDGESPKDLFKNADIAMYQTKANGRNGWSAFDPALRARIDRRGSLAGALRAAIAKGHIEVALQSQVDLQTGTHFGFEALARWNFDGKMIPPSEFIQIADETGLAAALGRKILHASLSRIRTLIDAGIDPGYVAVNVVAAQLKDPSFAREVAEALREFDLPASRLEIEVTENVLLERGGERIAETMQALHRDGVMIALDDFGTGYASLAHLKKFKVNRLKIDQSFVRDIGSDPDDAVIARTIINLAHSLGMSVVAEGIEASEQLDFLRVNSCDVAQGYLIHKPTTDLEALKIYLRESLANRQIGPQYYRGALTRR